MRGVEGCRGLARDALLGLIGEAGARRAYAPDSTPDVLLEHQTAVLARKPALRREVARRNLAVWDAYRRAGGASGGPVIEVGTGLTPLAGDAVVHTDVYASPAVDVVADAQCLPFKDAIASAVVGIHTFHHLQDPLMFLREAVRLLRPGGVLVLVEPNYNLFSRAIFGSVLHPEPFDMTQPEWAQSIGRPSDANQALSWIVFFRDRALFEKAIPELELCETSPLNTLSFFLVGGYILRQLVPDAIVRLIARVMSREPLLSALAVFRLTVLRRRPT